MNARNACVETIATVQITREDHTHHHDKQRNSELHVIIPWVVKEQAVLKEDTQGHRRDFGLGYAGYEICAGNKYPKPHRVIRKGGMC